MHLSEKEYTSRTRPDVIPAEKTSEKPVNRDRAPRLPRLLSLTLLLIASILLLWLIFCPTCLQVNVERGLFNFLFSAAMFVSLWWANGYLADALDRRLPWVEHIGKRFWVSMVATLVVTTIIVVCINIVFWAIKGYSFFEIGAGYMSSMVVTPIVVTLLISLFMHGRSFLLSWRQTAINAERLQKESIASQYESLKAQVNPHFLFNSLNALTSLVETDQKLAVKFIRKLSEVYRYVLESRQKEVVPLPEELRFLESYIYLQQIRLGNALHIQNDLPLNQHLLVVPMGLQLLLENAIKHNTALEDAPLHVHAYLQEDYLVVENNLQERRTREEDSTNMGLTNLQARYSYLTNKQVLVQQTQEKFIVKVPVLYFKD